MSTTKKQSELNCLISPVRIFRIKEQGYDTGFTDGEISKQATGLPISCVHCSLLHPHHRIFFTKFIRFS